MNDKFLKNSKISNCAQKTADNILLKIYFVANYVKNTYSILSNNILLSLKSKHAITLLSNKRPYVMYMYMECSANLTKAVIESRHLKEIAFVIVSAFNYISITTPLETKFIL